MTSQAIDVKQLLLLLLSSLAAVMDAAKLTVEIRFDNYPGEVGYSLQNNKGLASVETVHPGFAEGLLPETTFAKVYDNLNEGDEFLFLIVDTYGDGMGDGNTGTGFYALYYGDKLADPANAFLIYQGNDFVDGFNQAYEFALEGPPNAPHPAPTPSPPTATMAPTTCRDAEEEDFRLAPLIEPSTATPIMKTPQQVWPETNQFCVSHQTYEGCVNEAREDCQWIFSKSTNGGGVCRVDPLAACIKNGNCVCETENFQGGPAVFFGTNHEVLFHAPLSITAGDISKNKATVSYREQWTPSPGSPLHPQNPNWWISRVDFTSREYFYTFESGNPVPSADPITVTMKVHYNYYDVPMVGRLWSGLGLEIDIDTSDPFEDIITINGADYGVGGKFKIWTCTTITVTPFNLYINGANAIDRDFGIEVPQSGSRTATIGPFSGELFDVRVYHGELTNDEVYQVSARCAAITDDFALVNRVAIAAVFIDLGCNPDIGPTTTDGKQTYGSGPFATLWNTPVEDPSDSSILIDVPEGSFDEEKFFQHSKLQAYLWEIYMFDVDMIAFHQEPYRSYESMNEVPEVGHGYFNNPCKYMHEQFPNSWQFPIYGIDAAPGIPKWTNEENGRGDPDAIFDLEFLYNNQGDLAVLGYFAHEAFHFFQGPMWRMLGDITSQWVFESQAEFGVGGAFVATTDLIIVGVTAAPALPMNANQDRLIERGDTHFLSPELSVTGLVQGAKLYGSWILHWFLGEFVGMPHLPGQMTSNSVKYRNYPAGEMLVFRMMVENNGVDFSDMFAVMVAHMRTWDLPYGDSLALREAAHWNELLSFPDFPSSETLESRKTTETIDPNEGTNGSFKAGPAIQQPGPFGWNNLKSEGIDSGKILQIEIRWDDGMGFAANLNHPDLPVQQAGCDDDPRFYQVIVLLHNEESGDRRYWKMKGKTPPTLTIDVGDDGPVTLHIMLLPSPATDYVDALFSDEESGAGVSLNRIPQYSYQYKVDVLDTVPSGSVVAEPAEKDRNGILVIEAASPDWFPVRCTCMFSDNECLVPTFERDGPQPQPTPTQAEPTPTPPEPTPTPAAPEPTSAPIDLTLAPTNVATPSPTSQPTLEPTDFTDHTTPLPSSQPTLEPTGLIDDSECFPGEAKALVQGRGEVALQNLRLGDKVMVGGGSYESIYSFGHADPNGSTTYLKLVTHDKQSLQLTQNHLLPVVGKGVVPSALVELGDYLVNSEGSHSEVVAIETAREQGMFAPFTPSGTIVVNGIVASCYLAFHKSGQIQVYGLDSGVSFHWASHAFQFPHRFYCMQMSKCTSERYTKDGLSVWAAGALEFAKWVIRPENSFLLVSMLLVGVPLGLLFMFVESVAALLSMCLLAVAVSFLHDKHKNEKTVCKS